MPTRPSDAMTEAPPVRRRGPVQVAGWPTRILLRLQVGLARCSLESALLKIDDHAALIHHLLDGVHSPEPAETTLPPGDAAIGDRRLPIVGGFVDVDDPGPEPLAEMEGGFEVAGIDRADQP